jgi:hypothetical protein
LIPDDYLRVRRWYISKKISDLNYNRGKLQYADRFTADSRVVHYEAFHITATMASKMFNSGDKQVSDLDLLQALLKSWFNHSRSTEPMAIWAKTEDAVLMALSQKPFVSKIYDVGLLESNKIPWLAASPDDIVVQECLWRQLPKLKE